jgi:hypothetical protein
MWVTRNRVKMRGFTTTKTYRARKNHIVKKYILSLLTFPVVFLKKTTFLGVFENIIGCFSILQPKMRYKPIF